MVESNPTDNSAALRLKGFTTASSRFSLLIIGLLIFLLYFIFLKIGVGLQYPYAIMDSLFSVLTFAEIAYFLPYSSRYIQFNRTSLINFILTHIAGSFFISLIWTGAHYLFFTSIIHDDSYKAFIIQSLLWRFFIGILVYFIIQSFIYLMIYYDNYTEKTLNETHLKSLVTEAELKSLKFQINPHFIFNSLNSIAALTSIDPDKAREMTIMLADFLRSTLSNNLKQMNSLEDELRNIELYLKIEKVRFGDKFTFSKEVDPTCLKTNVPNMILQPLVENAIKYSVYESLEPVAIRVKSKCHKTMLTVEIENDYKPNTQAHKNKGAGVGLQNIQSRLRLIYDQENLFKIEKDQNIFRAILYIPVEEKDKS